MQTWKLAMGTALAGLAAGSVLAVSLPSTQPAPAVPYERMEAARDVEPRPIETWAAGSGALVPLMAVDAQASQSSGVDAPANTTGSTVGKPVDDATFVRKAAESGRQEVDSARDALTQLKDPDLKQIAEMLVTDHGSANERLERIARAKGLPLPEASVASRPAAGTAGDDFDARWTADMIAGHERAVALFRTQAQHGADQELRQFARDTLPTIERHLAQLRGLQK